LNAVGDNLDPMQGFAARMDLREIGVNVQDRNSDQTIVIHAIPNPAEDRVTFRTLGTNLSRAQISIVNALGQTVFTGTLDENGSLRIGHLSSGSYIARIASNTQVVTSNIRFVRQ
jgi:hypothetical protein